MTQKPGPQTLPVAKNGGGTSYAPRTTPVKKRSGWGWVGWLGVILLVLGVAAAGWYYWSNQSQSTTTTTAAGGKAKKGGGLREFHDAFVAQGGLPIAMVRKILFR